MAAPNILVVDPDEGFGFMLKEGLQNTGQYSATWVHTGGDALQAVVERSFDLVIIDIAVSDMPPPQLVQAIRDAKNGIKIMMIPMMGQDLPDRLKKLEINGVLPKPFFVGDLPNLIDEALGRPKRRSLTPVPTPVRAEPVPVNVTVPAPPPPTPSAAPQPEIQAGIGQAVMTPLAVVPQETIRFLRANEGEILRSLNDLNREVRAEAILLIAGAELIAQSGMLSRDHCQELAVLVAQSSQAAALAAQFLGERAGRFTQSLHEGGAYRLYTLTLGEGILLSLALSTNVPLGMIRHQCRQIAEQLSKYII
jgi:DNA-binding response OmpR family regulator/predicted regulator of Ras-like GTPase activity (Roadblock/LC7/MglB family)